MKDFQGGKRILRHIHIDRLHVDNKNPRLWEEDQNKFEEGTISALFNQSNLKELAESLAKNGYFGEEPLVIVPKDLHEKFKNKNYENLNKDKDYLSIIDNPKTEFIVVEGNRRLSAIKILLSKDLRQKFNVRGWPEDISKVKEDISNPPVIVYPYREDVVPYLGVRHITGIRKWDPYLKVLYIANLKKNQPELSMDDIQQRIGTPGTSTRKAYFCYKLTELMEGEQEGSSEKAKKNFSYLLLALGQGSAKEYLGISKNWWDIDFESSKPLISEDKVKNVINLFSFLFGYKGKKPVIDESRDITNYLVDVLRNEEATDYLTHHRNLKGAFDISGGEEKLIQKKLEEINENLSYILGRVPKIKDTIDITKFKKELTNFKKLIESISKLLKG